MCSKLPASGPSVIPEGAIHATPRPQYLEYLAVVAQVGQSERVTFSGIAKLRDLVSPDRYFPHLSHLSETQAGSLNGVCYMWWDGFPCLALAADPNLPTMQEIALRTMARILDFKSLACQESALHGLGHWQGTDDRRVSAIIDGFLEANPGIDTRLISYANSARCGLRALGFVFRRPVSWLRFRAFLKQAHQFGGDVVDPGLDVASRTCLAFARCRVVLRVDGRCDWLDAQLKRIGEIEQRGAVRRRPPSLPGSGGLLHRPAINRLDEQCRPRQAMPPRKPIDPGERQSRNSEIDMRDPKVIGHIDSGEKQCIVSLDRVGGGWFANPLVGFQQAFDMKREGLPRSCNHMVDRRRSDRARGEIGKRRRVSDVYVSFHDRNKGRHLQLIIPAQTGLVLHHFGGPGWHRS